MVNEKKKEVSSDEILAKLVGEPQIQGFRKGVTKKDILKNMNEDDWLHIDQMNAADERKTNELAYKLFVKNDQMYQQFQATILSLENQIASCLQIHLEVVKNDTDISMNYTEQKNQEGIVFTIDQLKLINRRMKLNIRRTINLAIADLSKLYTFVGHKGLDNKPIFTEEQYNDIAKNTIREFKEIGYEII